MKTTLSILILISLITSVFAQPPKQFRNLLKQAKKYEQTYQLTQAKHYYDSAYLLCLADMDYPCKIALNALNRLSPESNQALRSIQAKSLFREAIKQFEQGDMRIALRLTQEALKITPEDSLLIDFYTQELPQHLGEYVQASREIMSPDRKKIAYLMRDSVKGFYGRCINIIDFEKDTSWQFCNIKANYNDENPIWFSSNSQKIGFQIYQNSSRAMDSIDFYVVDFKTQQVHVLKDALQFWYYDDKPIFFKDGQFLLYQKNLGRIGIFIMKRPQIWNFQTNEHHIIGRKRRSGNYIVNDSQNLVACIDEDSDSLAFISIFDINTNKVHAFYPTTKHGKLGTIESFFLDGKWVSFYKHRTTNGKSETTLCFLELETQTEICLPPINSGYHRFIESPDPAIFIVRKSSNFRLDSIAVVNLGEKDITVYPYYSEQEAGRVNFNFLLDENAQVRYFSYNYDKYSEQFKILDLKQKKYLEIVPKSQFWNLVSMQKKQSCFTSDKPESFKELKNKLLPLKGKLNVEQCTWSFDGKKVAFFLVDTSQVKYRSRPKQVGFYDFTTKEFHLEETDMYDFILAFSEDSKHLLYPGGLKNNRKLKLFNFETQKTIEFEFAWSPDFQFLGNNIIQFEHYETGSSFLKKDIFYNIQTKNRLEQRKIKAERTYDRRNNIVIYKQSQGQNVNKIQVVDLNTFSKKDEIKLQNDFIGFLNGYKYLAMKSERFLRIIPLEMSLSDRLKHFDQVYPELTKKERVKYHLN